MTASITSPRSRKPNSGRPSGARALSRLWGRHLLPNVLPLLLGLGLAAAAAVLIAQGVWIWLLPLAFLVPAILLLIKHPFAAVLIWLLLFPFFVQESFPGSRYIYWVLHRGMIPGTLLLVVILELVGARKHRQVRLGVAEWIVLALLALSVANILWFTQDTGGMFIRFYDRVFVPLCMYGLVRLAAPSEKELVWLGPAAVLTILIQAFIGILSWVAPGLLPPGWLGRLGERTVGSFGNPAVYTTTLVFSALVLLQFAKQTRSSLSRWFSLAMVGLAFFCVFITFSRGSWLGGFVVWAGLIFLFPRTMIKLSVIGGLAAIVLGSSLLIGFTTFAVERFSQQSTVEGRIVEGAASLKMIERKPLFGWGYNNHEVYDKQFQSRVIDVDLEADKSSHNTYLLMGAEMGLVGLGLYFLPAVYWFIRSLRQRHSLPRLGIMSQATLWMLWLLLANHLIVMLFTDLFQSNFFSTTMWWMALGLIATILDFGRQNSPILIGTNER